MNPTFTVYKRVHCYPRTFGLVFFAFLLVWTVVIRWKAWGPAFPIPRTALILLSATLPAWAGVVLVMQALEWSADHQCQESCGDYEMVAAEEDMDIPVEFEGEKQGLGVQDLCRIRRSLPYMALLVLGVAILCSYENPRDFQYRSLVQRAMKTPQSKGYAGGDKIFIAALFFNNERVLPTWTEEMIKAIHYLGTDNVFVSIIESNSKDATPRILREFDAALEALGVARRILVSDTVHRAPPHMEFSATPRIDYLAKMRNQVLEPLTQATTRYDRVLFSNDVFIPAESIVELLKTNDGNYDQVCSMDFDNFGVYDAWVLRDSLGRFTSSIWPYFNDPVGAAAMQSDAPVPVFSCWNGITIFTADPFLPTHLRSNKSLSTTIPSSPIPTTHPLSSNTRIAPSEMQPYKFRHSSPGECFSAECFLISYDFRRVWDLQRIFVNPRVIVAYDWRYYVWYKYVLRHWFVRAWIEKVETRTPWRAATMKAARLILGKAEDATWWDGGDCFPWLNDTKLRNKPLTAIESASI